MTSMGTSMRDIHEGAQNDLVARQRRGRAGAVAAVRLDRRRGRLLDDPPHLHERDTVGHLHGEGELASPLAARAIVGQPSNHARTSPTGSGSREEVGASTSRSLEHHDERPGNGDPLLPAAGQLYALPGSGLGAASKPASAPSVVGDPDAAPRACGSLFGRSSRTRPMKGSRSARSMK